VPGDHIAVAIDQGGDGEIESLDRSGKLADLFLLCWRGFFGSGFRSSIRR